MFQPSDDPLDLFRVWHDDACEKMFPHPSACVLATADMLGIPSARVVLLKYFDARGFVFFTDMESRKGREMISNPNASLVFYWRELARQVRINGSVSCVPDDESDRYFSSRSPESKVSAICSNQSAIMKCGWDEFQYEISRKEAEFIGKQIPRPSKWRGILLSPTSIEFWVEGEHRRHKRLLYTKRNGHWRFNVLYP